MCIFCKKDSDEILHDFTSLAVDKKIRDMAKELEDFKLLSRISGGDLVAIEAQYHSSVICGPSAKKVMLFPY